MLHGMRVMEDKAPSQSGEFLFGLLKYYMKLRDDPNETADLTDQERHLLDIAINDYQAHTNFLAVNIIEPIRADNERLAGDAYAAVSYLVAATAFIHSILVHSESLKKTTQELVSSEWRTSVAANARKGKDTKPAQIALKNAVRKFRYRVQPGTHYRQASEMHDWVNEELNREGHDSVSIRKIERMLKKVILSD